MSRISTAFVVLLAALVVATLAAAAAPGAGQPVYLNPHAAIPARVNDLLHRMTLAGEGRPDGPATGRQPDDTTSRPTATAATRAGNQLSPSCLKTC